MNVGSAYAEGRSSVYSSGVQLCLAHSLLAKEHGKSCTWAQLFYPCPAWCAGAQAHTMN